MSAFCEGGPKRSIGSDWRRRMNDTPREQPDRHLEFLHELINDNVTIAGDVTEVGSNRWAIHGVIPVDGGVIVAEFDTYDQARIVLDELSAEADDEPAL
jgi:hypothetical protein